MVPGRDWHGPQGQAYRREVGEQVNGFLAGVFDGRGVVERGAYKVDEEVGRDGGRRRVLDCVERASGRAEIAPEELLLS